MLKKNNWLLLITTLLTSSCLSTIAHAEEKSEAEAEIEDVSNNEEHLEKVQKASKDVLSAIQPRAGEILGKKIEQGGAGFQNIDKDNIIKPSDGFSYGFYPIWSQQKNGDKITNVELILGNKPANEVIRKDSNNQPVEMKLQNPAGDNSMTGYTFYDVNSSNENFGIRYKNVGTLVDPKTGKAHVVDLDMTFYEPVVWDKLGVKKDMTNKLRRTITVGTKAISFATDGLTDVGVQYHLRYADTGESANLDGNGWRLNFQDVDGYQGVRVYKSTNDYSKILATPKEQNTYYNNSNNITIQQASSLGTPNNDPKTTYFGLFNKSSSNFYFHWIKDYNENDGRPITNVENYYKFNFYSKPDKSVNTDMQVVGQQYLAYDANNPFNTYIPKPVKTVHDEDSANKETDSKGSTDWVDTDYKNPTNTKNTLELNKPYNEFTYTIDANINNETVPYKDWIFEDDIDSDLEVKDVRMDYYKDGKWITNGAFYDGGGKKRFENKSSGNHIKIVASDEILNNKSDMNMYGKKYRINITVKRKTPVTDAERDAGKAIYKNIGLVKAHAKNGTALYDGSGAKTNEVETVSPLTKVKMPNITKKILTSDNKEVDKINNVHCGDEVNYKIKVDFPDGDVYSKFKVSDDLEDFLDLKSVEIRDDSGKDISKEGKLTLDNAKESFEWTPNNADLFRGKTIILTVKSNLKYDYKLVDNQKIDNVAKLDVDGKTKETPPVSAVVDVIQPTAEKWIINK